MPEIDIDIPTIFTTPGCVQCVAVKRYFKESDILYQEIDVTKSDQARVLVMEEWDYKRAPVVFYNLEHFSGFDPDRLSQIKSHYLQEVVAA